MSRTRPHFKVGDRVVDQQDLMEYSRAKVIDTQLDNRGEQQVKLHWDGATSEAESLENTFWPSEDFVLEDDFDADD